MQTALRLSNVTSAGLLIPLLLLAAARLGDTTRRDAAIASGAQYVSTDDPVPDPDFGTGYQVQIPGGMPGRCNPLNAAPACRTEALERLSR